MDVIILTGMSGAGKSQAAAYFEDHDYFCIDNLPPVFLPNIIDTFSGNGETGVPAVDKLCIVVDVRSRNLLEGFDAAMRRLDDLGCSYRIVFLEASDNVLVSRYRQTRRKHPLTEEMSLVDAIAAERNMLHGIRGRATSIIDTTMMPLSSLRKELRVVLDEAENQGLSVYIQSFGFMYGIPSDCDDVFDVRFLPNPFWVERLQMLCGKDKPIEEYLMGFDETKVFISKLSDMFSFMIPFYIREGKSRLNIGVGCTGGRHRSVFIAEELGRILEEYGYKTIVHHRDIDRDPRYESKPSGNS
ncbi:MAG: RNase adapter RapZ [Clostridiales bacterium]|nr:RNase adapter RapZ [Clostridiales bacterium]